MSQGFIKKLRAKGWTVHQEGESLGVFGWLRGLGAALSGRVRPAEGHS
jgi:hypothetical protein